MSEEMREKKTHKRKKGKKKTKFLKCYELNDNFQKVFKTQDNKVI